jgi:hypothetical protein
MTAADVVAQTRDGRLEDFIRETIAAVVLEAYVNGVSARKVDRLVEQMGIEAMTKVRVSAMCRALDEQVGAVPPAAADAMHETGLRQVIGLDIGGWSPAVSGSSFCAGSRNGPVVGAPRGL